MLGGFALVGGQRHGGVLLEGACIVAAARDGLDEGGGDVVCVSNRATAGAMPSAETYAITSWFAQRGSATEHPGPAPPPGLHESCVSMNRLTRMRAPAMRALRRTSALILYRPRQRHAR